MRRSRWSEADGQRLSRARAHRGDNQTQCADALRALGAEAATQGTVSNWERGRTGPVASSTLDAIEVYCTVIDGIKQPYDAVVDATGMGQLRDDGGEDLNPDEGDTGDVAIGDFNRIVAGLTGHRPLSERQSRLVDGLIQRLRDGPPMSQDDGSTARHLLRVLGLGDAQ
jgi:transcriptional regulator with XRE-family HTH domain